MAGDSEKSGSDALPPKLDLRKKGLLRDMRPGRPATQAKAPPSETPASRLRPQAGAEAMKRPIPIFRPGTPQTQKPAAPSVPGAKPIVFAGKPTPAVAQKSDLPGRTKAEDIARKPASKKETSRISLEAATSVPDLEREQQPKLPGTIRVKPKAAGPPAERPRPETLSQPSPLPPAGMLSDKRKTSRISLETALSREGGIAKAPAAGPKTIKLKRPSEAPTVKISRPPEVTAVKDKEAVAAGKAALSKTARLDLVPALAPARSAAPGKAEQPAGRHEGMFQTRPKTIRVKRPTPQAEVSALSAAGIAKEEKAKAETPAIEVDEPGAVFAFIALAAVLLVVVLIYVLTTQAYPQLNLAWPGKL